MRKQFIHWLFFCLALVSGVVGSAQSKDFTLKIDGYRGEIQWEQSPDNMNWSIMPGASTSTFTAKPDKTTYYRAKITEEGCNALYSPVKAAYIDLYKTMPAKLIKGKISQGIGLPGLSIVSFIDSSGIKPDGSFELLVSDSVKDDLLLVINQSGDVMMMADIFSNQTDFTINDTSTALALLQHFPGQLPIDSDKKMQLNSLYKRQTEFGALTVEIKQLIQGGIKLFSGSHAKMIELTGVLVNRDFNKDRFRLNKTYKDLPVDISSFGTTVKLENKAKHSYAVSIVKKSDQSPMETFMLYGEEVSESVILQSIHKIFRGISEISATKTLDFSKLKYKAGEYEFIMTDGTSNSTIIPSNALAFDQNLYDLIAITIGAVIPNPTSMIKDECLKNLVNAGINTINPLNMAQAAKQGTVLKDYIYPIFKDYAGFLSGDCLTIKSNKFMAKLLPIIEMGEKVVTIGSFVYSWSSSPSMIEACQYINEDMQTSTCFVMLPYEKIADEYMTGESVDLKLICRADKAYYPFTEQVVANIKFNWFLPDGGSFAPDNSVNPQGSTKSDGTAEIKWLLPCNAKTLNVQAVVPFISETLGKNVFSTKTSNLLLTTVKGDNQHGETNKLLAEELKIYFYRSNNLPFYADRVKISWNMVKGTGKIVKKESSFLYDSSFSWTLGPESGEQIVEATITSKNCDWEIQKNVIVFKAITPDPQNMAIFSGNNQVGAANTFLTDDVVVKVTDNQGNAVEKVTVNWAMVNGGGQLQNSTSVTDANGFARNRWQLGSTGEQKVSASGKKSDGTELSGSPAYFTALLAGRSGVTVAQVSGPNDVFIDDKQNLYITDPPNKRVLKVNLITQTVQVIIQDLQVGSVWVDANDNVYVTAIVPVINQSSSDEYRVYKLNQSTGALTVVVAGLLGSKANEFSAMDDIYVDNAGSIYIADRNNHRIQKWQQGGSSGQTVAGTGIKGSAPGELSSPSGVYFDKSGNMYVADLGNNRIQKSSSGGWVTIGSANSPIGIYIDANNNAYVSEVSSHSVRKILPGGQAVIVAGGNGGGSGANQLYLPCGIYLDQNGNIYIADKVNNRVQKWDPY